MASSLLERDAEVMQDRMRRTFAACRRAVETELAIGDVRKPPCLPAEFEAAAEAASDEGAALLADQRRAAARNGATPPGALGGPQNGAAPRADDDDAERVPASKSQLSYVRRLASSIGRVAALRVEVLVGSSYGKPLRELSRAEAGRLIATLRAVKSGELDWETLWEEAAR